MSMSKTEVKHRDKKVSTGTYFAGVLVDGWLCISGQGPMDLSTGRVVEGSIEDQTRLTLSHIGKVLAAGGSSLEDVVKCTCHLADIKDFDRFNRVYAEFFKNVLPARTTVQSVLWGGIKVEIDAIARVKV
ncbi:MAG TPA: Rid family hydrolase [Terriglobia bacterium]|nr:Rid family hydrolase [Terriglobia bacterium]